MVKMNYFFKLTGTEEKFTEEYLTQIMGEILSKEGTVGFRLLYKKVLEKYPEIKINRSALLSLACDKFLMKLGSSREKGKKRRLYFGLHNFDEKDEHGRPAKRKFERTGEYFSHRSGYISELRSRLLCSKETLYKKYHTQIAKREIKVMDAVLMALAAEIKDGVYKIEKCADICIDIYEKKELYLKKIESAVASISPDNSKLPCSVFINNGRVRKLLGDYGILKSSDFMNRNPKIILVLSCLDLGETILDLESLADDYLIKAGESIDYMLSTIIDDRTCDILLKRYGYFTGKEMTLGEVGDEYGRTKERIRQIEYKGKNRLHSYLSYAQCKRVELKRYFNMLIKASGVSYKHLNELMELSGDSHAFYRACILLEAANMNYKFDGKYHFIYDSDSVKPKKIEKEIIDSYGKLFAAGLYEKAGDLEKEVIDSNYIESTRLKHVYRLRQCNPTDFIIDMIGEIFPNGYGIYNREDYAVFRNEYIRRVGDGAEIPSMPAIRGIVGHDAFCQMDRGRYKLRKECTTIPQELFDEILDFILSEMPAVDYLTIYEKFGYSGYRLNKLGINNYYYMKGLIDYRLPENLTTKRNYITEKDNFISASDARRAFMRSFEGSFTRDELRAKYPGVKPYVFQFLCYEEMGNGLLQIGWKKYIYSDKLNISDAAKRKLKEIIEKLFEDTDEGIISSRKVYTKIRRSHSELLQEIPFIEDQFSTFCVIKFLYSDDYYLDRPYISKEKNDRERITTRRLAIGHLEEYDIVDYEKYRNYCRSSNIYMLYTYMHLLDEMSDNYVQIDGRRMIRKEKFGISEENLREIDKTIELICEKTKKLETATFNGYAMFPKIKYKWNKHVLAGIVRSYLGQKYDIINLSEKVKSEPDDYEIKKYDDGNR